MTPPTEPNFYFFSGHRIARGTQRVAVNEPVRVMMVWVGNKRALGVAMLGKAKPLPVTQFEGEWMPLAKVGEEGQP